MKKRIMELALLALCIFFFVMLGNLSCAVKAENSKGELSRFQTTLTLDPTKGNTSMIELCGPGSGGGRGPGLMVKLAYLI